MNDYRAPTSTLEKIFESNLDLSGKGLEIAPFFNPVLSKQKYNVMYTDSAGTEALREKAMSNPDARNRFIPEVDFVWPHGASLAASVPPGTRFHYAIGVHVLQRMPDTIGWIREIFAALEPNGVLALVIPDRCKSMDYFRELTTPADLVDAWLRKLDKPSPRQIYDFVANSIADPDLIDETWSTDDVKLRDSTPKSYAESEAMNFVYHSWRDGGYLDIHCTVWTLESFVHAMVTLTQAGLLNCHIRPPLALGNEFVVIFDKRGEAFDHPGPEKELLPRR